MIKTPKMVSLRLGTGICSPALLRSLRYILAEYSQQERTEGVVQWMERSPGEVNGGIIERGAAAKIPLVGYSRILMAGGRWVWDTGRSHHDGFVLTMPCSIGPLISKAVSRLHDLGPSFRA